MNSTDEGQQSRIHRRLSRRRYGRPLHRAANLAKVAGAAADATTAAANAAAAAETRPSCFHARGVLVGFHEDGTLDVLVAGAEQPTPCDLLQTSDYKLIHLVAGDAVYVSVSGTGPARRGLVLGRIGGSHAAAAAQKPEYLELDARKGLLLSCGQGSIEMRGDGRVKIRGVKILSQAEGVNHLKGSAIVAN